MTTIPISRAEPEFGDADRVGAGGGESEPKRLVHQPRGDRVERDRGDDARENHAAIESAFDLVGLGPNDQSANDRGEDCDAAQDERVDRNLAGEVGVEAQNAQQHDGDRGDRVRLEEVRCHAGAVTDVVTDVVGDHCRVTRVVLGDPGLDLADEVGSDVSGLGEDSAAEPGEHGDQRTAEAEADESVNRVLVGLAGQDEDPVVAGDAEERQADNEHAGDRTALEGDV